MVVREHSSTDDGGDPAELNSRVLAGNNEINILAAGNMAPKPVKTKAARKMEYIMSTSEISDETEKLLPNLEETQVQHDPVIKKKLDHLSDLKKTSYYLDSSNIQVKFDKELFKKMLDKIPFVNIVSEEISKVNNYSLHPFLSSISKKLNHIEPAKLVLRKKSLTFNDDTNDVKLLDQVAYVNIDEGSSIANQILTRRKKRRLISENTVVSLLSSEEEEEQDEGVKILRRPRKRKAANDAATKQKSLTSIKFVKKWTISREKEPADEDISSGEEKNTSPKWNNLKIDGNFSSKKKMKLSKKKKLKKHSDVSKCEDGDEFESLSIPIIIHTPLTDSASSPLKQILKRRTSTDLETSYNATPKKVRFSETTEILDGDTKEIGTTADEPEVTTRKSVGIDASTSKKTNSAKKIKKAPPPPIKIRFSKTFVLSEYTCDICAKIFTKNIDLQLHLLSHIQITKLYIELYRYKLPEHYETTEEEDKYLKKRSFTLLQPLINSPHMKVLIRKYSVDGLGKLENREEVAEILQKNSTIENSDNILPTSDSSNGSEKVILDKAQNDNEENVDIEYKEAESSKNNISELHHDEGKTSECVDPDNSSEVLSYENISTDISMNDVEETKENVASESEIVSDSKEQQHHMPDSVKEQHTSDVEEVEHTSENDEKQHSSGSEEERHTSEVQEEHLSSEVKEVQHTSEAKEEQHTSQAEERLHTTDTVSIAASNNDTTNGDICVNSTLNDINSDIDDGLQTNNNLNGKNESTISSHDETNLITVPNDLQINAKKSSESLVDDKLVGNVCKNVLTNEQLLNILENDTASSKKRKHSNDEETEYNQMKKVKQSEASALESENTSAVENDNGTKTNLIPNLAEVV